MRAVFLTLLVACAASHAGAAEECIKQENEYYGSKYYNKCACESFSYPDVAELMKPHGIKSEPRWVACSTFDGGEWCVCGVRLSWIERPTDVEACKATKEKVKLLVDKLTTEKKDFGVSWPLICR